MFRYVYLRELDAVQRMSVNVEVISLNRSLEGPLELPPTVAMIRKLLSSSTL